MYPGFHRAYAERLAWRARLLLALLLLPLGLFHPLGLFLSLLSLLLPSQPFEGRALSEIARRHGLAYQTALEYQEDPLWEAAKKVKARLPPCPWGLLGLYLTAFLFLLLLHMPTSRAPSPLVPSLPQMAPEKGQEAPSEKPTPSPGEKAAKEAKGQGQGQGRPADKAPSKTGPAPWESPKTPKKPKDQAPTQPLERPGQGKAPGPPGQTPGRGAAPGLPLPQLTPKEGPRAPLPLGPGEGEKASPPPPSPWPQGPPREIRRSVEVYLEKTEPPPEVRELIRRYFNP